MLVACVKVGDKYSDEYVTKLKNGVARYLKEPHDFVCYTDNPVDGVNCEPAEDLPGWWAKLGLFKQRKPMLYFDLDVVITGDLARLIHWPGFGIIKDWWRPGFNSSVMKLSGDEYHVWEKFQPRFMGMVEGDQDFLNGVLPDAKTFPRDWVLSYKGDRVFGMPPDQGAMVVVFHGIPKPHQLSGWVKRAWI